MKSIVDTYNEIGNDFDKTRRVMWPEFGAVKKLLLDRVRNSDKKLRMLDSGCGNGRMAHFFKDFPLSYYGYDGSKTLIKKAKEWWAAEGGEAKLKAHFSRGEILTKTYEKPFDVILSSAVIHHLPSRELQLAYLKKLHSLLSEDGFLYISTWNLWQPKYINTIDKKTHACYVPWGKKTRFYYAFEHSEFVNLLTKAGFITLEEVSSTHNFCFIAWKK